MLTFTYHIGSMRWSMTHSQHPEAHYSAMLGTIVDVALRNGWDLEGAVYRTDSEGLNRLLQEAITARKQYEAAVIAHGNAQRAVAQAAMASGIGATDLSVFLGVSASMARRICAQAGTAVPRSAQGAGDDR